jgi:hypothetical protein
VIPFCVQQGYIDRRCLSLLERVRSAVLELPDGLSCHAVCAALACSELLHCRGKFAGYDHSWLEVAGSRVIIDPYPWACASGPLLLDVQTGSPWAALYVSCSPYAIVQDPDWDRYSAKSASARTLKQRLQAIEEVDGGDSGATSACSGGTV